MPIWNWNKIMETGDLKYMYINGGRVSHKTREIWERLQNEYFAEFGLDEGYKKQLRLMKEVVSLNAQFIETKDRFILNFINIAEMELAGSKKQFGLKFYDLLDKVMTAKKMYIDPKIFPVKSWYYALKNLSDGQAN